jgi:hypothetical protein
MPGPLEEQFSKMWTERLEGATPMLETAVEGRDFLTPAEQLDLVMRMIGATRDAFILVTREIDKLNAS